MIWYTKLWRNPAAQTVLKYGGEEKGKKDITKATLGPQQKQKTAKSLGGKHAANSILSFKKKPK